MLQCYNTMFMLQFYVVSCYIVVLCVIILFCYVFNNVILLFFNVTILLYIWLILFVMLYHCFVRYNVVLCIVMLFCNDASLFYRLQYYGVSYYIIL